MNAITLTKKLIAIPSYLGNGVNEKEIGDFIFEYLKKNTDLEVTKQLVKDGRCNIIAKDKYPTKLLWCGHIDTVQLQNGWEINALEPFEKDGKLYGLGASDMKSGIAVILSAVANMKDTKGLMLLFYVDEEYDFLGTKIFVEEYQEKIKPKYIISGDGKSLSIGNACRGLIEIRGIVKGQTGHASQPEKGKNAILRSVQAINKFNNYVRQKYSNTNLLSVTNLAFLQGGLDQRKNRNDTMVLGREGNNISDIAEFVLEIRPANEALNATRSLKLLTDFFKEEELAIESLRIRHDLGSWMTEKTQLKKFEKIIGKTTPVKYLDPTTYGFIDLQLLWNAFGKVPCFTFGAGIDMGHRPNEYTYIQNILETEKVYQNIIKVICR